MIVEVAGDVGASAVLPDAPRCRDAALIVAAPSAVATARAIWLLLNSRLIGATPSELIRSGGQTNLSTQLATVV